MPGFFFPDKVEQHVLKRWQKHSVFSTEDYI